MVQPFRRLCYLEQAKQPESAVGAKPLACFDSVAYRMTRGDLPEESFRVAGSSLRFNYAPGMAWVAQRELLERCQFYDAAILGGGDKLMFSAACGRAEDEAHALGSNLYEKQHYLAWAKEFHEAFRGKFGYVEGDIYHLWHGDLGDRGYGKRREGFDRFNFDPACDISKDERGVWCWNSQKPELHKYVRDLLTRIAGLTEPKADLPPTVTGAHERKADERSVEGGRF